MNRLRQAREYVGFSLAEAGSIFGLSTTTMINVESGVLTLSPALVEKAGRLYRRPVSWLKGDPAEPVHISSELDRLMDGLSDHDRGKIVAFAEFLQHPRSAT